MVTEFAAVEPTNSYGRRERHAAAVLGAFADCDHPGVGFLKSISKNLKKASGWVNRTVSRNRNTFSAITDTAGILSPLFAGVMQGPGAGNGFLSQFLAPQGGAPAQPQSGGPPGINMQSVLAAVRSQLPMLAAGPAAAPAAAASLARTATVQANAQAERKRAIARGRQLERQRIQQQRRAAQARRAPRASGGISTTHLAIGGAVALGAVVLAMRGGRR